MTKREAYTSVVNGEITEEVISYFKEELNKINDRDEARKRTLTPRQQENERIKEDIINFFNESKGEYFIEDIVSPLNITRQRCSILCNQLVQEEKLLMEDVRVKNKGKRKKYFLPKKD